MDMSDSTCWNFISTPWLLLYLTFGKHLLHIDWLIEWHPPPISNQESLFFTLMNPRKPATRCNYPGFHISLSITHLRRKSLFFFLFVSSNFCLFSHKRCSQISETTCLSISIKNKVQKKNVSGSSVSLARAYWVIDFITGFWGGDLSVILEKPLKYQPFFTGHSVSSQKNP